MTSRPRFLIKVARPGFWLTSVWFYLLPLGQREVFGSASFWLGLFYVTFPLGMIIYGWNDMVDAETDRLNPRKDSFLFGARPSEAQIASLPIWIAFGQLPFAIAFYWLIGWPSLLWWAALVGTTALYNWPKFGFKNLPFVDLLNQCGYLLVFVLASWLSRIPQVPWFTFVFGALFAMHSHLFGQIMDYTPDRAAGRRSTAVTIGPRPAKLLMIAFLVSEALLVHRCTGNHWLTAFLFGGSLFFVADLLFLWGQRPYTPVQMRLFFLGWNATALLSLPAMWHSASLAAR